MRLTFSVPLIFVELLLLSSLMGGCRDNAPLQAQNVPLPSGSPIANATAAPSNITTELLQQSWAAYRQRFIQPDGRVIDREANERSTSEGQAYAMLRSVFIDDPKTFGLTLDWAEKNLRRQVNGKPSDTLWAWQWGRDAKNNWGTLDRNFASDADIDAITALIFASRRWQRPDYLRLAQTKLQDLWALSIVSVGNQRYLLPGPKDAFQQQTALILNPSYFAPYAFRLFAEVDSTHDWLSLVNSSYQVIENSASLSAVKLPSDWVALDTKTGQLMALSDPSPLISRYGFDAYRVWWRIALDAAWFGEPRARDFLQQHTDYLQQLWRSQHKILAQIDLQGKPAVPYEATSQYGALYAAFRLVNPSMAEELYQRKLLPQYHNGIWDNDSAYYTQNLVWLGLLPSATVSAQLLQLANPTLPPHP